MTQATIEKPAGLATEATATFDFNTHARCDACGAQAYMRATRSSGGVESDLLFCAHHGKKSKAKLELQGFTVLDRSDLLESK